MSVQIVIKQPINTTVGGHFTSFSSLELPDDTVYFQMYNTWLFVNAYLLYQQISIFL